MTRRCDLAGGPSIGGGSPLVIIAGPCVVESEDFVLDVARELRTIAARRGTSLVFKASFDKANRTAITSFRGPGVERGLAALRRVREEIDLPVTTDFHEPEQASAVAAAVDLLQIPAFLCRQTDMLRAAAGTGRPVNVKKGQFMAPSEMRAVVDKLRSFGAAGLLVTERGTTFGYNDLVVDFRGLPRLRALAPVVFDVSHSVQHPGKHGHASGGDRESVFPLARAALAVGIDALFVEVHPDPDRALSDGPIALALDNFDAFLTAVLQLDSAVRLCEAEPGATAAAADGATRQ